VLGVFPVGKSREQPFRREDPVEFVNVRYTKTGVSRFFSHRDIARAFERVIRRAEVPVAYSSGFTPHPRISYANVASTGSASNAEYLQIALSEEVDVEQLCAALDTQMPVGMNVLSVVKAKKGLAAAFDASLWHVDWQIPAGVLSEAVTQFLAAESVEISRKTKDGERRQEIRPQVLEMTVENGQIEMLVAHTVPLVRPQDVLKALQSFVPSLAFFPEPRFTRLEQVLLADTRPAVD
jgi:radical SAM-linked protein